MGSLRASKSASCSVSKSSISPFQWDRDSGDDDHDDHDGGDEGHDGWQVKFLFPIIAFIEKVFEESGTARASSLSQSRPFSPSAFFQREHIFLRRLWKGSWNPKNAHSYKSPNQALSKLWGIYFSVLSVSQEGGWSGLGRWLVLWPALILNGEKCAPPEKWGVAQFRGRNPPPFRSHCWISFLLKLSTTFPHFFGSESCASFLREAFLMLWIYTPSYLYFSFLICWNWSIRIPK